MGVGMTAARDEDVDQDLRWVRVELAILAGSRLLYPFTADEQARYDLRCQEEQEFLSGAR